MVTTLMICRHLLVNTSIKSSSNPIIKGFSFPSLTLQCIEPLNRQYVLYLFTNTGGPCISWFLVPMSNHEMRESWIPRTVFSVKPQNGSKIFLKSTFWVFFSRNLGLFFLLFHCFPLDNLKDLNFRMCI